MSSAGARRRADVLPQDLDALNEGRVASRTLAEALAMDHAVLIRCAVPQAGPALKEAVDDAKRHGILKRMQLIGQAMRSSLDDGQLSALAAHPSDTVRGWACFAAIEARLEVAVVLARIRMFADDEHFAVREWAWMAARPRLVEDLELSITLLSEFARDDSERIRRFASEVLRPRGVWAAHIPALKHDPDRALPILENLRRDPSRYVQDSVANWINDAAKSDPDWAREIVARWLAEGRCAATERIAKRGLRSL